MSEDDRREWHLDRRVTLTLIVALLANAAATVYWAGQLDQRVTNIEMQQARSVDTPERIARVETQVQGIREYLQRIDRKLDRLIEDR